MSFQLLCFLALTLTLDIAQASASEVKFQAILIWGTNSDKPSDPKLKEVDANFVEKLKKIFKWNHYFEVNRHSASVADTKSEKFKLSEKCEVEIKNLGKAMIEVKLYGEGKLVRKVTHPMPPGESLVLAGDDKNDTAWFILITPR